MHIEFSERFIAQLQVVLDSMPRKYRTSIHFSNPNIRDFIYKGYVVPYLIDSDNDKLVILGICKWNLWQPND